MQRVGTFVLLLVLAGCAPTPTAILTSLAIQGASYVTTGKSVGDHALSVVTQQDCATWRLLKDLDLGAVCRGEDETAVAVVAGDTGPPPTEAAAALQTAPLVSRIDDARARAAEAAIVAAVIGSIARDPGFVSAIVSAAVAETPVHREAIVSRASAAFPGFAVQIAQAAAQERRVPH